jgi:hypothetical protein
LLDVVVSEAGTEVVDLSNGADNVLTVGSLGLGGVDGLNETGTSPLVSDVLVIPDDDLKEGVSEDKRRRRRRRGEGVCGGKGDEKEEERGEKRKKRTHWRAASLST